MNRYFRRHDLLLIGILAIALFLRLYRLDASSLWHDEGNTWALIQRPFAQIARDAAADIHPPGYYWLLKVWSALFGSSAYAMRSLSAVLGVLLVFVTYAIGRQVESIRRPLPYFALLAAWIVTLNPFQIYYSQEARMYVLLALESAGLFWALLTLIGVQSASFPNSDNRGIRHWLNWPAALFLLCGVAGLWTHYIFPIMLAAAGISYLIIWLLPRQDNVDGVTHSQRWNWPHLIYFGLLNIGILLAYLPWLSTAIERVRNWPKGGVSTGPGDSLWVPVRTLLFGPLSPVPAPPWPWLLAGALLPLLGFVALRHHRALIALTLWLLAPLALMLGLGLFTDAFLKFLLVASSAWCLLVAGLPHLAQERNRVRAALQVLLAIAAIAAAAAVLPSYYTDANARDNYAGVADYIDAVGDLEQDVVLLNASGQQEVWSYYDPGLPILALPATRPVDVGATVAALAKGIAGKQRIFALFWATDESDPDKVVETWLDRETFRGPERWQGNMRFVTYSVPEVLVCRPVDVGAATFAGLFALDALCSESTEPAIAAGDALAVGLQWRPLAETATRYKVTLQLLNEQNQVVAQRDGEPGGGSTPTSTWQPGQLVADNHALWVPFGTPPGRYRLLLAIYDPQTGERLATTAGDAIEWDEILITRPLESVPASILPMQYRSGIRLGAVDLLGYSQHRKGFAHAPETPLQSGETVELVVWWQAPDPLSPAWPEDGSVTLTLGGEEWILPLGGSAYPTADWQPGEIVRTVYEIPYDDTDDRVQLAADGETVLLAPLPE